MKKKIIIFGTSRTDIKADPGARVNFSVEYTLSETKHKNSTQDDHLLFIRHHYMPLHENKYHLIHIFSERLDDTSKLVYRAHMRMDSVTEEKTGLYFFVIKFNELEARIAFKLTINDVKSQSVMPVHVEPYVRKAYGKLNPLFGVMVGILGFTLLALITFNIWYFCCRRQPALQWSRL